MRLTLRGALVALLLIAFGPERAAAFVLTGKVVDPDGFPVHGVDLDVDDLVSGRSLSFPDDNTHSDGRFMIELPAGAYRLLFEPPAGLPIAPHVVSRLEITRNATADWGFASPELREIRARGF